MGPHPGQGTIAPSVSTQSGSDPGGLPPSCSCTSTLRSCIRHPWLPTHKDRRTSALAASINDLGWADLGSTRTGYPPVLIYMGLETSDPRIRKRPKLDQHGSNCHLRSAGRPFSEEAGPKPLHMAYATLSCWNPAGGRGIQELLAPSCNASSGSPPVRTPFAAIARKVPYPHTTLGRCKRVTEARG